jgi:hypothetical protein
MSNVVMGRFSELKGISLISATMGTIRQETDALFLAL